MERNKKIIIASGVVSVMVLFMGIAFAALASNLNISFGNVTQNALTWNVGFKGSSVTPTTDGTSTTGLSCGMATITPSTVTIADSTLSKPDDKCTYTLTIENKGDISANLSAIAMSQPTNMTCTKPDEATMVCGNITFKLKTSSGLDFTSGVTIESGEEYDLSLIIQYTGTTLSDESITLSSSKVTFTYIQSAKRASSIKPDGIKDSFTGVCKRAKVLHTEECDYDPEDEWSYTYCARTAGYTVEGAKGTTTIKYGSLGTKGTLTAGDAFDCDVNGDGKYDAETERFYYLSGINGDSSSEYAALVYYIDVSGGTPNSTAKFQYNSNNHNYEGPVTAYEQLPSTTQWSNVSLTNNGKRQIYTIKGTTSNNGGTLPVFEYTNKAARLMDYREANAACGIEIGTWGKTFLTECEFVQEHTGFSTDNSEINTSNYLIESPNHNSGEYIYLISPGDISLSSARGNFGVRPVIEVPLSDMDI